PAMVVTEAGALYFGDISQRAHGVGDGLFSAMSATAIAVTGNYAVAIIAGSRFTVTDPNGRQIGTGTLGTAFKASGLSFTLPQGISVPFVVGNAIGISVTSAPSGSVGTIPDPISALGALPTSITLDLV